MAVRTGFFGMGPAASMAVAVAGLAVVGLVGRDVYMRGQVQPAVVTDPAASAGAPQAGEAPADPPAPVSADGASDSPVAASGNSPGTATPADTARTATTDNTADTGSDGTIDTTNAEPADTPANEAPALAAPRFDLVRVDPDGTTVIAGTGPAGATAILHLDDVELDSTVIDTSGKFAAFLSLDPSDQPRLLTLLARLGDAQAWSEDRIILAPMPRPAPETLAAADPGTAQPGPATMSADPTEPDSRPATGATSLPTAAEGGAPVIPAARPEGPEAALADASRGADPQTAPRPVAADTPASPDAPAAPDTPGQEPSDFAAPPAPQTPAAVAVLRAGADGVELLRPGTPQRPEALDRLSLDTISYTDGGEVLLSGRAPEGAAVRVYIDNVAVADLPIGDDGRWQGEVTGVRPGVYTLRLDQLAVDGQVGGRLETPFKREAPAVLAAARDDSQSAAASIAAVTVQRGDTLWAISQDRYGSGFLYVKVFEANRDNIRDPDLIYPGQVFAIPN